MGKRFTPIERKELAKYEARRYQLVSAGHAADAAYFLEHEILISAKHHQELARVYASAAQHELAKLG